VDAAEERHVEERELDRVVRELYFPCVLKPGPVYRGFDDDLVSGVSYGDGDSSVVRGVDVIVVRPSEDVDTVTSSLVGVVVTKGQDPSHRVGGAINVQRDGSAR
jgi:hypothetical protein